jgi:hypothetical protein
MTLSPPTMSDPGSDRRSGETFADKEQRGDQYDGGTGESREGFLDSQDIGQEQRQEHTQGNDVDRPSIPNEEHERYRQQDQIGRHGP